VFLTGHTGFKGTWLCALLNVCGAEVVGYALDPPTTPNLYGAVSLDIHSIHGDVRDRDSLVNAVRQSKCDIFIHMAAQPIVRESYVDPAYTYETNVMGTVNTMEAVRLSDTIETVVVVTTDKVYKNNEWHYGYRECDALDGYDPYSNSKSCAELVSASYARSFLKSKGVKLSTARAGNVIGGGDWAKDRIIPDCVRAAQAGLPIVVRNPHAIRPYQHVLEPLYGYLLLAASGAEGAYNVGPDDADCVTTGVLTDVFCKYWPGAAWHTQENANAPHEASFLKLDTSLIRAQYGYRPRWHIDTTVQKTVEMYCADDMSKAMYHQIEEFLCEKQ
jgi:CDP-glucose 4,6-dehydratase